MVCYSTSHLPQAAETVQVKRFVVYKIEEHFIFHTLKHGNVEGEYYVLILSL